MNVARPGHEAGPKVWPSNVREAGLPDVASRLLGTAVNDDLPVMRQIVYVSSSVGLFSRDDLQALLTRSREKNTRLNITGLLLYRDGNIVQVLEGEEPVVRPLLEKIGRDPRHTGIIVLLDREVTERDFPEWSMGFRDLTSPEVRRLPGYSEFLNQPLTAELGAGRAHRLLQLFKEKM